MAIPETELFLQAGIALARAQLLERVIINCLVDVELMPAQRERPIPADEWEKKYDDYVAKRYKSTLGPLIKAFKSAIQLPRDLEQTLEVALKLRNRLIHHFFKIHEDAVLNPDRSGDVILALLESQKAFQAAEQELMKFMRPIHEKHAVTPAMIQYLKQGKI